MQKKIRKKVNGLENEMGKSQHPREVPESKNRENGEEKNNRFLWAKVKKILGNLGVSQLSILLFIMGKIMVSEW